MTSPTLSATLPATNNISGYVNTLFNFPPNYFQYFYEGAGSPYINTFDQNNLVGTMQFSSNYTYIFNTNATISNTTTVSAFTVEFWFRANGSQQSNATLFNTTATSNNNTTTIQVQITSNNQLSVLISGAQSATATVTTPNLTDNVWHHLAVAFQMNEPMRVYFDAESLPISNSWTLTYSFTSSFNLSFGNQGQSSSHQFKGEIGYARIWNYARSLQQTVLQAGKSQLDQSDGLYLYWSASYDDGSTPTMLDNSGHNNTGTFFRSSNSTIVWDATARYGALHVDTVSILNLNNMTGNLVFSRQPNSYVQCLQPNLGTSVTGITFEFWIRVDSATDSTAKILHYNDAMGYSKPSKLAFSLSNASALQFNIGTISNDGSTFNVSNTVTSTARIADGLWHSLAITFAISSTNTLFHLFLDGQPVVLTNGSTINQTATISNTSFDPSSPIRFGSFTTQADQAKQFIGDLSDIQVWNIARNQSNIQADMDGRLSAPYSSNLKVYWTCANYPTQNTLSDATNNGNNGVIGSGVSWENNQVIRLAQSPVNVSQSGQNQIPSTANVYAATDSHNYYPSQSLNTVMNNPSTMIPGAALNYPALPALTVLTAFEQAQQTGFFDPIVFPQIFGFQTLEQHEQAKEAIEQISQEIFLGNWLAGLRLSLHTINSGQMIAEFLPITAKPLPILFIEEEYHITSYYGAMGEGKVVRVLTLMPGETTQITTTSYRNTETSIEETSSIFDSYSDEASNSFEQTLQNEQSTDTNLDISGTLNADVSLTQRWGTGHVKTDVNGSVSGNAGRKENIRNMSSAIGKHAIDKSSKRDVNVETNTMISDEEGQETNIVRTVSNINVSRTLNFMFRQLNQAIDVFLHLTNVRVGYYDDRPGMSMRYPLQELDDLLDLVLIDDAEIKLGVKTAMLAEIKNIQQLSVGQLQQGFILQEPKFIAAHTDSDNSNSGEGSSTAQEMLNTISESNYYINNNLLSYFWTTTNMFKIPGIIMNHQQLIMRTDNVVVDTELGANNALDTYSQGLQEQAIRLQTLENDRLQLALEIINSGDAQKAALYAQIFRTPPTSTSSNYLYVEGEEENSQNGTT